VMEKLVEEVSFTASDRDGEKVTIDRDYVNCQVGTLVAGSDLSKFIL
jgi:ATP-dependent HslUV protease ATP-binding subunit HslU